MNCGVAIMLLSALVSLSCKDSGVGPLPGGVNLLTNSAFRSDGNPSLQGWVVSDSSNVRFSVDKPRGGLGETITLDAEWFGPWPGGSIYQLVAPPPGTHRYRLSFFGKRAGVPGACMAYKGRPVDSGSALRMSLTISDSVWRFYSLTDTIGAHASDTLFIIVSGGQTEIATGRSFFNTCKFEKLD